MIAGSKAAAKTEQEAKKVREADPFDVFQDIIHISPAQPVLFEGGSFCILLSDEETYFRRDSLQKDSLQKDLP